MIPYIQYNPDMFVPESVVVKEIYSASSHINEDHLDSVDVSKPVILAEIAPGRYNLIDGNHRAEKAIRLGINALKAYRLTASQHIQFLADSTYLLDPKTNHGNKIPEVISLIRDLLEYKGNKLVIFSQNNESAESTVWDKKKIQIFNFISAYSIEHRILHLLEFKKTLFAGVLDELGEDQVMIKGFMKTIQNLLNIDLHKTENH